ncbi:hypothetical protein M3Y94_01135900 [Aphelenchoides besseyi]|nr:hypothetical protein M3Y94_01135900 [Aphelenchoides besseyi]KAI6227816.1 hypothetical protein M3Y95_00556600 [Aphelenchoides besseyi]
MHSNDDNRIGVLEAISYCIGDIIGSGIFVSPAAIYLHSCSIGLSLVIWICGALIAAIGCFIYVELGTKIRRSGCDFAYLSEARWKVVAVPFLYVSCGLIYPTILAIQTLGFGEYLVNGFAKLVHLESPYKEVLQRLTGFMAVLVICSLNLFSLKTFASRFQIIVTISKFLVMGLIIVTGFYYLLFKGGAAAFKSPFAGSTTAPGDVVLGLYASLFAYNGWDILNFGTEEIENPRKTLPIAGISGILAALVSYLLMNIAYFSVLSIEDFTSTDAVAVVFAEKTMGDFHYIVPFLIALLLLGNLNSTIFGCSRYVLSGANNGYLPSFLRTIHPNYNSPRAAVLVEVFIAMGISFLGDLDQLVSYMSFAMWCQRLLVQFALIYMRFQPKRFPYPKDAFVVPLVMPFLFICVCLGLLIVPLIKNYFVGLYAGVLILVGLIVYFTFIYPNARPNFFKKVDHVLVVASQLLLNVELENSTEKNDAM